MADNTGAAFGVFPQMRPRRARQDREAAANAPLSALRGWAAGTAGLPGDIEGLLRMLVPGVSNEPALPTSEFYKEWLPGRSLNETPTGRAFTEAGSLAGGVGVGPLSRVAATSARAGGRLGAEALVRAMESGSPLTAMANPMYVVKPKGGNWLSGSVEDSLSGLKVRHPRTGDPMQPPVMREGYMMDPQTGLELEETQLRNINSGSSLNNWIDKQLTRYVKNEMATPEDPIRALAERGVLHYTPENITSGIRDVAGYHRSAGGYPVEGSATSDLAKAYETLSDFSIGGTPAGEWRKAASPEVLSRIPGLERIPDEAIVYERTSPSMTQNLGFTHLIDELRNATNPASGLPPELLLKYSSLPQVSVPQAVERVSNINAWRAAQKAEADLARANNAATVLHKEYPDKGFKWVELKKGEQLPEGWTTTTDRFGKEQWVTPEGKLQEVNKDPRIGALEDALKYEGDTMGHCVGGYCPDVAEGRSRIFSLRSAKGEPHVTIEVAPQNVGAPDEFNDFIVNNKLRKQFSEDPESVYEDYAKYLENIPKEAPSRIVQIKGKANRAPNPEYLPFVQDFVKSGKWSDVGDLENTGLVRHQGEYRAPSEFQYRNEDNGDWQNLQEFAQQYFPNRPGDQQNFMTGAVQGPHVRLTPPKEPGFARGGLVQKFGKGGVVKAALEEARDTVLKLKQLRDSGQLDWQSIVQDIPTRFYRGMSAMVRGGEDSPKYFEDLTEKYLGAQEPLSGVTSLAGQLRPPGILTDMPNMRKNMAWAASNPLTAASYASMPNSVMVPLELTQKPGVIFDAKGAPWQRFFSQTGRLPKSGKFTLDSDFKDALRDPEVKSILVKNIYDTGGIGSADELSDLYGLDILPKDLISSNLLIKDPSAVRYTLSGETPMLKEPKLNKAEGGLVQHTYDPAKIDALTQQLQEELHAA